LLNAEAVIIDMRRPCRADIPPAKACGNAAVGRNIQTIILAVTQAAANTVTKQKRSDLAATEALLGELRIIEIKGKGQHSERLGQRGPFR